MNKYVLKCSIFLLSLLLSLTVYAQDRQTGQIKYRLIEYPAQERIFPSTKNNPFVYFDKIEITTADKNNLKYVNISIFVEKAVTAQEAIDKWSKNVRALERLYKDISVKIGLAWELYGNFCWNPEAPDIEIKYRTKKERYPRNGWYISTKSITPPDYEGKTDYGEFFLSEEGVLMPAMRVSQIAHYP